jgi:thiazole/oxazole-forming peptide maturase SagD family component
MSRRRPRIGKAQDLVGSACRLATLACPPGAPFRAFVAVIETPPAALPASNRIGARIVAGLGSTEEDARLRTLAEGVERDGATYRGDERTVRRSPAQMDAATSTKINRMLQISPSQEAGRALWNLRHPGRHEVPPPVNPQAAVDWIEAADGAWFPAGLVLLGHPDRLRAPWAHAHTSGLAFGWSTDDAHLRALLELVERDAVAMWWYHRISRPTATIPQTTWVRDIEVWLSRQSRHLSFLDLTHDLRIPVVAAVSWTDAGQRPIIGTGAGTSLLEAAETALRENLLAMLNLARLEDTAIKRGAASLDHDAAVLLAWHQATTVENTMWLTPSNAAAPVEPLLAKQPHDVRSMWHELMARLGRTDLTPLIFDLSRGRAVGAVTRVIVPSLRTTLARFGEGRLYEVPVRLGWTNGPKGEESLNPEPYPF